MSIIKILLKDKAKAIANGQFKEVASICNAIGSEYLKQEKYEYALQEHFEELEYCQKVEDELGIAVANRRIGECYAELYEFDTALSYIDKFKDISVRLKSIIEEQRAWATLGRTYYLKYQHDYASENSDDKSLDVTIQKAELAYLKALKLTLNPSITTEITSTELAEMKCRLYLNLGLIYEIKGNYAESLNYMKTGMEIAQENNLYEDIFRCGLALGNLYQKLLKHAEAENKLNVALAAAKKLHNKNLKCEVLLSKAINLICLERYKEAKKCLKLAYKTRTTNSEDFEKITKALKVCIGIENYETKLRTCENLQEQKMMLEKIADGLSSINCFPLAIKKYHMTLDCMEKAKSSLSEKAPIYFSLAETYLDNGNSSEAIKYFKEELNCNKNKPREQIQTLWKIAEVLNNKKLPGEKEESYLTHAVSLAEEVGDQKYIYNSLNKLLEFYKSNKTGDIPKIQQKLNDIADKHLLDDVDINNEENEGPFSDIPLTDLSDSDDDEEITAKKRSKKIESKVNEKGETPLHQACINNNFNLVKRLVENGHSVNIRDYTGWTPLHEACNHGFYDIVEFLLENGAEINDPGGPECKGITPLHDAASCGNLDVIQLLISKGANVTAVDENGETALDALIEWRKRSEKLQELDDITLKQCKAVEEELKLKMIENGYHISKNIVNKSNTSDFDINCQLDRKRNRSFSSSNSDSDDYIRIPPYLNENDNQNCNDAKTEYKTVMENLRHRTVNVISPNKNQKPKIDNSPLVNENEVINDWLIKDTGKISKTKRKKRRINKLNVRTSKCIDKFLISQESSEENINNFSDDSNNSISTVNAVEQNTVKDNLEQKSHSAQKLEYSAIAFCLRVNVSGKLIFVPVPDETCTINWLKEAAALRFQAIDGNKPHLILTKNGALLSGSDLIKNIFFNNEEVLTSVEKWDEPSLDDKYVQLCNKHNIIVSSGIRKRFSDITASLECKMNISNCCISYAHINVIFHTLLNYKNLKHLNLSGTDLNNSDISKLSSCILSLTTLHTLNFSCCNLTSEKIKIFFDYVKDQISKTVVLPSLKIVDLSYNSFSSCPDLIVLFKLSNLCSLNLCSCGLDSTFLSSELLQAIEEKQNLEILDISDNVLGGDGISYFLHHLPKNSLRKLNLKYVVEKEEKLGFKLQSFLMRKLPYLKEINLQGCFLTDIDLDLISASLTNELPELRIINLSENSLLSCDGMANFINKLYENDLTIIDLNITGTCKWENYHYSGLADCLKLKTLKHLCFNNCPENIIKKIMQSWTEKWEDKAVCFNYFSYCELSVK